MLKKITKLLLVFTLMSQIVSPIISASANERIARPNIVESFNLLDWTEEQLEIWGSLVAENFGVWQVADDLVWVAFINDVSVEVAALIDEFHDLDDAFSEIVNLVEAGSVSFEDAVVLMENNTAAFHDLSVRFEAALIALGIDLTGPTNNDWTEAEVAIYLGLQDEIRSLFNEARRLQGLLASRFFHGPMMIVEPSLEAYILATNFRNEFLDGPGSAVPPPADRWLPFNDPYNIAVLATMNEMIQRLEYFIASFKVAIESEFPTVWTEEEIATHQEREARIEQLHSELSDFLTYLEAMLLESRLWRHPNATQLYNLLNMLRGLDLTNLTSRPYFMTLPFDHEYNMWAFGDVYWYIGFLEHLICAITEALNYETKGNNLPQAGAARTLNAGLAGFALIALGGIFVYRKGKRN